MKPKQILNKRKHRDLDRYRISSLRSKIGNNAVTVNNLKMRVEELIERGLSDNVVRARYGMRAIALRGHSLDQAIAVTNNWYLASGHRFVLCELRLILRLLRRERYKSGFDPFPGILSFLSS